MTTYTVHVADKTVYTTAGSGTFDIVAQVQALETYMCMVREAHTRGMQVTGKEVTFCRDGDVVLRCDAHTETGNGVMP